MTRIIQYEIAGAKLGRQSGDMTNVAPSKDDLERQKLGLEIRELQRKWWQRPVYLSVLLPMVLASLTVLAGILSGYFSRERIELQRDIHALKAEKTALIQKQADLSEENRKSLEQLIKVHKQVETLESVLVSVTEELGPTASPTPKPPSN